MKFKEYRDNQIKANNELKKKNSILEERKLEDEQALYKDSDLKFSNTQAEVEEKNKIINKLRKKLKYYESEIRDLKYENERDKEDMVGTIKELNKESKLYAGISKMILSENEIKRILEVSLWNEDNEEWKIKPFSFHDKKVNFPGIKAHQGISILKYFLS